MPELEWRNCHRCQADYEESEWSITGRKEMSCLLWECDDCRNRGFNIWDDLPTQVITSTNSPVYVNMTPYYTASSSFMWNDALRIND